MNPKGILVGIGVAVIGLLLIAAAWRGQEKRNRDGDGASRVTLFMTGACVFVAGCGIFAVSVPHGNTH